MHNRALIDKKLEYHECVPNHKSPEIPKLIWTTTLFSGKKLLTAPWKSAFLKQTILHGP